MEGSGGSPPNLALALATLKSRSQSSIKIFFKEIKNHLYQWGIAKIMFSVYISLLHLFTWQKSRTMRPSARFYSTFSADAAASHLCFFVFAPFFPVCKGRLRALGIRSGMDRFKLNSMSEGRTHFTGPPCVQISCTGDSTRTSPWQLCARSAHRVGRASAAVGGVHPTRK